MRRPRCRSIGLHPPSCRANECVRPDEFRSPPLERQGRNNGAGPPGWHGGYYHGGYRGWGPGAAVGAGLLGLAVGTAIAERPYAPAYYGPRPVYGYGYSPCGAHLRWDPYVRHYVRVGYCY